MNSAILASDALIKMQSTIVRRIKHTPDWRKLVSATLLIVGTGSLIYQDPKIHPLVSVLLIVSGIAIFLLREFFTITYDPNIHTISLEYRGKRVTVPTENAKSLLFKFDGNEGVIILKYADGTSRQLWDGACMGNVAEAISELLDIEYDIKLY